MSGDNESEKNLREACAFWIAQTTGEPADIFSSSVVAVRLFQTVVDAIITGRVPGLVKEDPVTRKSVFMPLLTDQELELLREAYSAPFEINAGQENYPE